jgi:hypothetical protein
VDLYNLPELFSDAGHLADNNDLDLTVRQIDAKALRKMSRRSTLVIPVCQIEAKPLIKTRRAATRSGAEPTIGEGAGQKASRVV